MRAAMLGGAAALLLASCSGTDASPTAAHDLATDLAGAIPAVTKVVDVTEDNDPNNDIGRPGSYQQAAVLFDSRTECNSGETVHVSCGAKIEVFDSESGAEDRMEYLQSLSENLSGLVREYDYTDGSALLRISGELKPSAAAEYEAAFTD